MNLTLDLSVRTWSDNSRFFCSWSLITFFAFKYFFSISCLSSYRHNGTHQTGANQTKPSIDRVSLAAGQKLRWYGARHVSIIVQMHQTLSLHKLVCQQNVWSVSQSSRVSSHQQAWSRWMQMSLLCANDILINFYFAQTSLASREACCVSTIFCEISSWCSSCAHRSLCISLSVSISSIIIS